jgi:hypothetical protein
MVHSIKELLDIRVQHPVHLLSINPGTQSIQRIVLAAPRSKSIRKAHETLFIDGFQHINHGLLDNFVFQTQDTQRPFRTVRFRDRRPSSRLGTIATLVYLVM